VLAAVFMFAREGYVIMGASGVLGALLAGGGFALGVPWSLILGVAAVILVAFTFYFFRDPDRTLPPEARAGGNLLLAPADGKVVEIRGNEHEPLYLEGPARRVSIFLSLLDVHVNRVPASGVIEQMRYVPGGYLVAWHPKASEKNERAELGLRHTPSGCKVLFKQIAGKVARRIVCYLDEGDEVRAGERFGIVKFGSRMDVFVPPGASFNVSEGDRVRAGETVLGRLPERKETEVSSDGTAERSSPKQPAASR
jgi:phosphatidylserine decarboxylase